LNSIQTYSCLGHCITSGNKPAPPSDHIPLARRSAFAGRALQAVARPAYSKFATTPCNRVTVHARRVAVQVRSFFQNSERSFFVNKLHSEPYAQLHSWLSSQHPGLRTFKILQHRLALLAADHPEQRAMCRLLHGIINSYVEEFDEAPLPTAIANRARQRLLRSLAEIDSTAEPARQLGNLNRLAGLSLSQ
jgi:hypothetical protein